MSFTVRTLTCRPPIAFICRSMTVFTKLMAVITILSKEETCGVGFWKESTTILTQQGGKGYLNPLFRRFSLGSSKILHE